MECCKLMSYLFSEQRSGAWTLEDIVYSSVYCIIARYKVYDLVA